MSIRALILLLLFATPLCALDPGTALTQFIQTVWLSEQGLPQNSVTAIVQTADGYLWLGTQEGLVRFDGTKFVVFDSRNTPEIGNNFVLALLEDRQRRLWIGTYGGLVRLEHGRFTQFTTKQGLPNEQVRALLEDDRGTLWVGTLGGGLARLDGERFVADAATASLPGKRVRAIVEDRDGSLWLATEAGLAQRTRDGRVRNYTTAEGLTSDDTRSLWIADDATLWIGTEGGGLNRFADDRFSAITTREGLVNDVVRSLYGDGDGNLWIGTFGGGAQRLRGGKLDTFSTAQGLPTDQIWTFYEDRERNFWIGTDAGGLTRLKEGKVKAVTTREGLSNDVVLSILEDRDGSLWLATYGGGLNHLEDGVPTAITTRQGLSNNIVQSLHQGRDGTLWIGTSGGGLNRLTDGKLTAYTTRQGLGHDFVRAILEDRDGNVWIGTDGGGLSKLREGVITTLDTTSGLASDVVLALHEDRTGVLWIGTDGGLNRLHDGKLTSITTAEGLSHDIVSVLYEDAGGVLWIGTSGGGLNRWKNGRLTSITTKQGLFDDNIAGLIEDEAGDFWLTCNKGIFRVPRKELDAVLDGKRARVQSTAFGTADGMRSVECNAGSPAAIRTRDGALWFPTIRGAVFVHPRSLKTNAIVPPVTIERVLVDGKAADAQSTLRVPPGKHSVEVHYTALSFRTPERVQFKYRLEGFDEEWIDAGTRRAAYYTNLPHGEYRFRVLASNDDGLWNETGATLAVAVQPRLLEMPWVRVLLALALALLIYAVYRLRVRQMALRERELVALVEERTKSLRSEKEKTEAALADAREHERTAEEANQAKTVFLANMSHELRTPLNTVLGFAQLLGRDATIANESREGLGIIQRSGEHLLELINDVLSISKIEAGRLSLNERPFDLRELLASVESMIRARAETKGLDVVFTFEGALVGAVGDDGKLRQVLINLLGNAVKFTERGRITLRAAWRDGRASFEVSDTGPGIAPHELERLFQAFVQTESGRRSLEGTGLGLVISREIVRLMGGEITVESRVGEGTTFSFTIDLPSTELRILPEHGRVIGLAPDQPSPRILVVDDTDENRLLLLRLLGSLGFTVREAANGALAVEMWQSFRPDAIFMDMRMPVMDGTTASRRIRELEREEGAARHTVIIALTASVFEHERDEILASGSDDFVLKPFRVEVILDRLAERLGIRYRYEEEQARAPMASHPGIDVEEGVRRASGNFDLYRRLVASFARDSHELLARLQEHVDARATREALDLLHTLRGTAATLGAHRVANAAAALEASLRDDEPPSLDELSASLHELRESAGDLHQIAPAETVDHDAPLDAGRTQAALAIAGRLHPLLAANDLAAIQYVADLQACLAPRLSTSLHDLQSAVDRLDFEAARTVVATIESQLRA